MQSVLTQQRSGPMAACRPSRLPAAQRIARLVPACRVMAAPRQMRKPPVVVCSSSGVAHPGEESQKSAGFGQFQPSLMSVPNTTVARAGGGGGMGSNASLGAVMEKSKLQFVMPTPPQQAPKLDDGGDGGDIGKHNHNGGGGGDGGDDDDDDYFNDDDGDGDGDGEGEGNSFFRTVVPESYDKLSVQAVLSEWMRTVAELPQIIRRAVEMGLFSSAQLVRFFSMDVRPNAVRTISRSLPPTWARDFVGRLMADPAFVQKLVMEATFAASMSMWYEYRARGERFQAELDLALINTIGMAFATAATMWLVAPTRSYGSVHKFPWQQMLDGLPNCVFDASGPLRQYSNQARFGGLLAKSMELSAVGAVTGTVTSLLSSAAVALHQRADPTYEPSVPVPNVGRSSGGLAAFFAVNANARYQLIGGMDRYLFGHANFMWTYVAMTAAARLASQSIGEMSRWWWQGLPEPKDVIPQRRKIRRVVRKLKQRPATQQLQAPAAVTAAAVASAATVSEESELLAAAGQYSSTRGQHAEEQQQSLQSHPVTLDLTAHTSSSSSGSHAESAGSLQLAGVSHAQAPAAAAAEAAAESSEDEDSGSGSGNFEVVDQLLADSGSVAGLAGQSQLVGAGRYGSRGL